jgi:hypothetical protein
MDDRSPLRGAAMGFELTRRVWSLADEFPDLGRSELQVLLVLADHADDESCACWPSQARVASRCRISRDSVSRAVAVLRERGWVSTQYRSVGVGDQLRRGSDQYVLTLPAVSAGAVQDDRAVSAGAAQHPLLNRISGRAVSGGAAAEPFNEPGTPGSRPHGPAQPVRLPVEWAPNAGHRQSAAVGVDVDVEAQHFRLHAEAHDRRLVSWDPAFTSWLLKARPAASARSPVGFAAGDEWMEFNR